MELTSLESFQLSVTILINQEVMMQETLGPSIIICRGECDVGRHRFLARHACFHREFTNSS